MNIIYRMCATISRDLCEGSFFNVVHICGLSFLCMYFVVRCACARKVGMVDALCGGFPCICKKHKSSISRSILNLLHICHIIRVKAAAVLHTHADVAIENIFICTFRAPPHRGFYSATCMQQISYFFHLLVVLVVYSSFFFVRIRACTPSDTKKFIAFRVLCIFFPERFAHTLRISLCNT